MALSLVVTGNVINAADINSIIYILQRQVAQTETGKYFLSGGEYANLCHLTEYMQSLSRTTVPVSVVVDEADQGHTNLLNAPGAGTITANGFLVDATVTGATTNAKAGGNFTITF